MAVQLSVVDIVIVCIYFAIVIGVGIFAMCRATRGTVSGYFLAGRAMNFIPVGASLFVSNIGSEHFIGLSGSGAAGGIGVGAWEFNAILLLQLLGWVFIPVYIACGTVTMPQYLSKRFGGARLQVYFAVLSLLLYILTKCSVDLYTGALFIQQSLGWDLYLSIFILIVVTGLLTITGGLTAVIYTDTLQALLMVGGAIVLMIMSFIDLGGYNELIYKYPLATPNVTTPNTTCGQPSKNAFTMLRDIDDPDMPWLGFLLGQTPASIWYWCNDQVIVQRALAAKSLSHAQGATLLAGVIKILPLFIMVMPGMISRIKYPNEVACVDPDICYETCQSYAGCTNIAYPKLVLGIMPSGLRGLMMAVMIAALMSDLDSIFNSASTLFTIDIWKRIRKQASVKELMIVGRVFIFIMILVAVAWVPVVKETQGGQVFIYIQEVTDYLVPPIAACFLMAMLIPRVNEQGAFWGLMIGLAVGLVRLVLVFVYRAPETCNETDHRPDIIKLHFMYFAMILFWVTVVATMVISFLTKPPPEEKLLHTTYWSRHDPRTLEELKNSKPKSVSVQTQDNPEYEPDQGDEMVIPGHKNTSTQYGDSDEAGDIRRYIDGDSTNGSKQTVFTISDFGSNRYMISEENDENRGLTCRGLVEKLCGLHVNAEQEAEENKHESHITSLEQDRTAKIGLTVGLVLILLAGTFLYCFWSLWSPVYAAEVSKDNPYIEL